MIKKLFNKLGEAKPGGSEETDEVFVQLDDGAVLSGDGSSPETEIASSASGLTLQTEKGVESISDRVVLKLLEENLIPKNLVRKAVAIWAKKNRRQPLWRTLLSLDGVDEDSVYSTVASVYSFPSMELSSRDVDKELVKNFVDGLPPRKRLRLLELQLLPIRSEKDQKRKVNKLVFASYDPARMVACHPG